LSVYSEALLAYLYDPAFEPAISAEAEAIADLGDGEPSPAMVRFACTGMLLVVEQFQDDPVTVELIIGEPLTTKEKRQLPLRPVVRGQLNIVSGKLAVHSPATAQFADPIEGEFGMFVELPVGTYVAEVHHIDFDEFARRFGDDLEWPGSAQVVVLTPSPPAKPVKKPQILLPYPDSAHRGLRRWKVADGVASGEVIRSSLLGISSLITSIPKPALDAQFGDLLPMELKGEPGSLLLAGTLRDAEQAEAVFGQALTSAGFVLGGYFMPVRHAKEPKLFLFTVVPSMPANVAMEGDRVRLWPATAKFEPAPIVRGEGRVLAVGGTRLFLDLRLEQLGRPGEDVYLDFGGETRRVRISSSTTQALDQIIAFAMQPATRFAKEREEALARRWDLICESTPDRPESERAPLEAEIRRLEELISEYRLPDEARQSMPLVAEPFFDWLDPTREITMLRALSYDRPIDLESSLGSAPVARNSKT